MVEAEVKLEEKMNRPIGRRKVKALEYRNGMMRKKFKFTSEAVKVAKRRNDFLQAQHEMGLFTCKIDQSHEHARKYLSLMRKKALMCVRACGDLGGQKGAVDLTFTFN